MCSGHWRRLPDDVKDRLREVFEDAWEGVESWEFEAAVRNAQAILEESRR